MVIVSIVTMERGWKQWEKRMMDINEKVMVQPVLFETARRCAENYFAVAKALYQEDTRRGVLDKYEPGTPVYNIASQKEYLYQLIELHSLAKNIPEDVFKLLSQHGMKIFPNPFQSSCSVLTNLEEKKLAIKEFVKRAAPLPMPKIVIENLESYIRKYRLEEYLREARKNLLSSWPKAQNDRFFLATYLKAREVWPRLEILTSDTGLDSAGKQCPSKFSVRYLPRPG